MYPDLIICVPPSAEQHVREQPRVLVVDFDEVDSRLTREGFLVWIDSDLRVLTREWLHTLLMYCEQPDVGCVAPLMVCGGRVWCSGLVLGGGGIGYAMRGLSVETDGYAGSLSCSREVSAVSGECLMISGALFRELGGRVRYYSLPAYDGADLALRALMAGRRNIVTPGAIVRKSRNSVPQTSKLDGELFHDRWKDLIRKGDRYYNCGFSMDPPNYALRAVTPAIRT